MNTEPLDMEAIARIREELAVLFARALAESGRPCSERLEAAIQASLTLTAQLYVIRHVGTSDSKKIRHLYGKLNDLLKAWQIYSA